MNKRIFYVVYFDNPDVQRCLDAILLLCNPKEKGRAHITVRGPRKRFTKESTLLEYTHIIKGKTISIHGVDHFFDYDQNTVFLKCQAEQLRQIWKKPDYMEYNPHITLYDGDSRVFALELFKELRKLNLLFSCIADGLRPIISRKGQLTLDLPFAFDSEFVSQIIGDKLSVNIIDNLDFPTRLSYVVELARRLPEFGSKPAQISEALIQL